jgi:glycosyltransferase involved in cell wall biosynthesis
LAQAAIAQGYRVAVLCRDGQFKKKIESSGVEVFDWRLNRGSLNPLRELVAIWDAIVAMRGFRPNIVHAVAMKPVVYSALASGFTNSASMVYALGGLGFIFSSRRPLAHLIRPILLFLLRWIFSCTKVRLILQNPDDRDLLLSAKVIDSEKVRIIRGAGVDTREFSPQPNSITAHLVVLPARLLWDKGVGEFVAAARSLKNNEVSARFVLVGEPDTHNPECISQSQIDDWVAEGVVESWGSRDDMNRVLNQAMIVCLPSYREGLPKVLLEAASCGRPIVTFDVPGCREVVVDSVNGFIVPPRDVGALTNALKQLLLDPELCNQMGMTGRQKVLNEFSQEQVAKETVRVWREVLS